MTARFLIQPDLYPDVMALVYATGEQPTGTVGGCRFQKGTAPVHWVGRTECIGLLTPPVQ